MGGQACVLYGAAEFSRDVDFAILADAGNLRRLRSALKELQAEERPAPLRDMVAERPLQHRKAGLEDVQERSLSYRTRDLESRLAAHVREQPWMMRECDANHGGVWTSTDSTAGRSRTMGARLSPASFDAYTCPPVVPKYTPLNKPQGTAF